MPLKNVLLCSALALSALSFGSAMAHPKPNLTPAAAKAAEDRIKSLQHKPGGYYFSERTVELAKIYINGSVVHQDVVYAYQVLEGAVSKYRIGFDNLSESQNMKGFDNARFALCGCTSVDDLMRRHQRGDADASMHLALMENFDMLRGHGLGIGSSPWDNDKMYAALETNVRNGHLPSLRVLSQLYARNSFGADFFDALDKRAQGKEGSLKADERMMLRSIDLTQSLIDKGEKDAWWVLYYLYWDNIGSLNFNEKGFNQSTHPHAKRFFEITSAVATPSLEGHNPLSVLAESPWPLIAHMHFSGIGTTVNMQEAKRYAQMAKDRGYGDAVQKILNAN